MAERSSSLAKAIDAVRWDYDPEGEELSPLVSTERYFRDFPWEPEEVFVEEPEADSEASGDSAGESTPT
jgi:hypothetical protein